MKSPKLKSTISLLAFLLLSTYLYFAFIRIDLTDDKRFTISKHSKELMDSIPETLDMTVYLDGDLNPGFQRLKRSTKELIEELNVYSQKSIRTRFINPSEATSSEEREKKYTELAAKGLNPIAVYERDKEGKSIQKVIFPWLEIRYQNKRIAVNLLKNIPGNQGEQNLNISIENLEFQITDGIRRIVNNKVHRIAFIEGHGELNEMQTLDITKSLSDYFQIDRGVLMNDASILNKYEAVIIANPQTPFKETDKFILDQYLMRGGRILWLVNGTRYSKESLSVTGFSPTIKLDINLDDQLFKYGVRINPVILQDVQCASVPVNIAPKGEKPQFEPTPWYYSPILLTSPEHAITRNITGVKAEFCAGIDLVGENKNVRSQVLLVTSNSSHIIGVPSTIDLSTNPKPTDKTYFNMAYLPVAVYMEGNFESDFANRMPPPGLANVQPILSTGNYARQIVVANGDIIRNETYPGNDSTVIPLGYDRYMNQQFGNKDFILNSVLYLTDTKGWMELRNRTIRMRLLNKNQANEDRVFWQTINVLLPLLLLGLIGTGYFFIRRRIYTR